MKEIKKKSTGIAIIFIVIKIAVCILVILFMISLGKKAYRFGYQLFAMETVTKPPGKDVAVTVGEDITSKELSRMLEEKGLVKDKNVFQLQITLLGYKNKIKNGSYVLNTSQTAEEMLIILAQEQGTESETDLAEILN